MPAHQNIKTDHQSQARQRPMPHSSVLCVLDCTRTGGIRQHKAAARTRKTQWTPAPREPWHNPSKRAWANDAGSASRWLLMHNQNSSLTLKTYAEIRPTTSPDCESDARSVADTRIKPHSGELATAIDCRLNLSHLACWPRSAIGGGPDGARGQCAPHRPSSTSCIHAAIRCPYPPPSWNPKASPPGPNRTGI